MEEPPRGVALRRWARHLIVIAPAALLVLLAAGVAAVWTNGNEMPQIVVAATMVLPPLVVPEPAPTVLTDPAAVPRGAFAPPLAPAAAQPPATTPPPRFVQIEPAAGAAEAPDDARPAWQRNRVQVPLAPDRPVIAVVMDDMGLDRRRSARVVSLPAPLTLAYLPYANDLPRQAADAAAAGHELIVHVPMEPLDPAFDPGPNALRSSDTVLQILNHLHLDLAQFDGYGGISNHMGSRFSSDRLGMALVLETVRDRGLLYLDSLTTPNNVAGQLAAELGVTMIERDVFLDADRTSVALRESIGRLEERALAQGYAIGIGHPYDVTIEVLSDWLVTAEERGFQLAPISAISMLRNGNG